MRTRRADTAEAQQDQHERDREFHREAKPDRHGKFEDDDRGANRQHGQRMPETPDHADPSGRGETALAAQDGGDRDYVIGVGRMAHPEQQSEQCDSKWCGTSRIHRQLNLPSRAPTKDHYSMRPLQMDRASSHSQMRNTPAAASDCSAIVMPTTVITADEASGSHRSVSGPRAAKRLMKRRA